ncbi:DUF551 domain-containing protein [Cronobacter dublinensis]|uniref:DUF551 domain-containing protein n=1 Tax=Cronobacter dublinensis TaxID=413497 RepID=UPI000CFB5D90|nr:DUF551 domain-containing protein [Cronobacter dublinensis]
MTFTKEQLIAAAHGRIDFANMMLSDNPEPLKERTWSIELELARIALSALLERAEPVATLYKSGKSAKVIMIGADLPDGYTDVFTELQTAPPAPVEPGWIACSERMPSEKTGVLVATELDGPGDWRMKWGTRTPGHPDAKNGWLIPGASWAPSHWMPLPEAPGKEG